MVVTPKPDFRRMSNRLLKLTEGKLYLVLGIEADDYRIINDENDPVLYSPQLFNVVDPLEPEEWISTYGDEGERYAYPPAIGRAGFFEDYHDGCSEAVSQLWDYVKKMRAS